MAASRAVGMLSGVWDSFADRRADLMRQAGIAAACGTRALGPHKQHSYSGCFGGM